MKKNQGRQSNDSYGVEGGIGNNSGGDTFEKSAYS